MLVGVSHWKIKLLTSLGACVRATLISSFLDNFTVILLASQFALDISKLYFAYVHKTKATKYWLKLVKSKYFQGIIQLCGHWVTF